MAGFKSEFLQTVKERGFIHQCTNEDGLDKLLDSETVTAYIGFDATAGSLHVGSLVQIMWLRWLQKTGHKPVVLMGGGTTKVGDPSGKDESRQLLDEDAIKGNIASIRTVFEKFLDFGDDTTVTEVANRENAVMVDNSDWLDELKYIEMLREVGRHFSVNRMLTMESVKQRLEREQNLSFLEFNYMILQSYDYVELYREYGCKLQLGASDQWGNIVMGIELARRMDQVELYGLTSPLITTSSGAKMGKSAAGAVWLNEDLLSVYDYYQFWRNTEDVDVGRFLRLFTELDIAEIEKLERLGGVEINEAKKILALEATAMCHGRKAAEEAAETARKVFEEGASGDALPSITVERGKLAEGIPVFVLLKEAGLVSSNGEAKRLIKGGGARINDAPVSDEQLLVNLDAADGDTIKLSAGKKRHALVRIGE